MPTSLGIEGGARIARILKREGDTLRAGNLLLRAHLLSRKAQDQLSKERDQRFQSAEELARALAAAHDGTLDDATRARGWALMRAYPWGSDAPRRAAAAGRR